MIDTMIIQIAPVLLGKGISLFTQKDVVKSFSIEQVNRYGRYIGQIIRKLCEQKKVEIHEATACKDHIHLLVSIPPNLRVAQFVGYLKGKSALIFFDRHANLKYKYGNRHFWCRGYYVDTVSRNAKMIGEYIKNQLQEDIASDQISLKEYMDPFTGSKNK